jgi:site-specific DNA recombinase
MRRAMPPFYNDATRHGITRRRPGQLITDAEHPPSGLWRPNTVSVILNNPVYKCEYTFGRRTAHGQPREIVTCPVPPLVSVETWAAAQAALERNMLWSGRNAKREYLLRGLMRCGLCGHLYIGDGTKYNCYAHRRPTILYGRALGKERRCPAPAMNAARIESQIWTDVEEHLRNPERTLRQIAAKLRGQQDTSEAARAELAAKQREMASLQDERDILYTYFRKGKMSERDLDRQEEKIAAEEAKLAKETASLAEQLTTLDDVAARLDKAAALLQRLRARMDSGPLTPALKRELVEALVDSIVVCPLPIDLNDRTRAPHAVAKVTYTFDDEPASSLSTVSNVGIADSIPMRGHNHDRDLRSSGRAWAGRHG